MPLSKWMVETNEEYSNADKLSIEVEERANLDLLTKANSFREAILEKENVLEDLEDTIIKMEESKKDFKWSFILKELAL